MNTPDRLALIYVNSIKSIRIYIIKLFKACLFVHNKHYNKILVNRDGEFGDSIVVLPALSIIRQNFPNSQLDLLTINNNGVTFKDLNLDSNLVNNLIIINKDARVATLNQLKKNRYDLFIQLPQNLGLYKSIRNMFLVRFMLGINSAFGWDHGRIKSFMRLQKEYLEIPTETDRFINNIKQAGLTGKIDYPINGIQPGNKAITNFLETPGPIVFIIGGKLQPKKWPLDHWVSLANLIDDKHKILIVGGKDEIKDAEFIISKTKNTINACDELSIPELFYVLKNIAVAISLDTGAMHLCDAAGTKIIALISTRELTNKWHPNNRESIVIEKVLLCSFCLKTVCANNICMKYISADEVYTEYLSLIERETN
ncbi:MAG: hypothetical protein O7D86_05590 [Proteobacteria bacterium]|nr:hypothetical protein [Pseudomonadota bacterium]